MIRRVLAAVIILLVLAIRFATPVAAQTPILPENSVVNAASFVPFGQPGHAMAPGSIVTIFGSNFASALLVGSTIPLSTSLGGVSIAFNGTIPGPFYFVSQGQLGAQLPAGLSGSTATIVVRNASGSSATRTLQIAPTSPSIFTTPAGGAGQGIVTFALDPTVFAAVPSMMLPNARPARVGDFLIIYANGLGATQPAVPDGAAAPVTEPLARTVATPVVTLGGVSCPVLFSGRVPGLVGLDQINIQVAIGVTPGNAVPLQISLGGVTSSNLVTIAVQ